MADLRAALVDKLRVVNGLNVEVEQVVLSNGAVQGLFATFLAMLEPGDEVLVPDPGWPNYAMMIQALHGVPRRYHLTPGNAFVPQVDELASLVSPRTKAILLNSPSNPLGSILPRTAITDVLELAGRHDLWVVSDECYESITFDEGYVGTASLDSDGRVISVFSFSKTYAMTGWRVGYVVGPREPIQLITKLQEPIISCVNTPAQRAALAALTGPQDIVETMRAEYHRRRDAALAILDQAGVAALKPAGGFFVWADVSQTGRSSLEFAKRLIHDQHVAVAPGTAFGPAGEGAVRISLATAPDQLVEGCQRLAAAVCASGVA